MAFVLVPVPEEHVLDVMRYVLRRSPAPDLGDREPWDEDSIRRLMNAAAPASRELLRYVARSARRGFQVTFQEALDALETDPVGLFQSAQQLMEQCKTAGRQDLLGLHEVQEPADGGGTVVRRFYVIDKAVAELVEAVGGG